MAAKRKLFITHAGELAHRLVRAVERDGLVAELVRSYAERHGRRKVAADPARLRELERTLGREALLVMTIEIRRLLPRTFASGPGGALRPEEATLCDAFYAEFLASLERAIEWPPAEAATEAASFQRDLDMYRQWSNRSAAPSRAAESPFPDRCAILLDPAMMEQARRTGAGFEVELTHTAAKMLGQLGRSAVKAARRAPGKTTKAKAKRRPFQVQVKKAKKRKMSAPGGREQPKKRPGRRAKKPQSARKRNNRRPRR